VRTDGAPAGPGLPPYRAGPRTLGESARYPRCLLDPTWGTVDPNLTTIHDGARDARGDGFVCAQQGRRSRAQASASSRSCRLPCRSASSRSLSHTHGPPGSPEEGLPKRRCSGYGLSCASRRPRRHGSWHRWSTLATAASGRRTA